MNSKKNQVFNLLLIEYIFSKKSTKHKTKTESSVWNKPWLRNHMYTSAFSKVFAELMVNDRKKFRRYLKKSILLRINKFSLKKLYIYHVLRAGNSLRKVFNVIRKEATGGVLKKVFFKIAVLKVAR